MTFNELAIAIANSEGKKKQVNIADIREILSVLSFEFSKAQKGRYLRKIYKMLCKVGRENSAPKNKAK